jgi:two-component system chemotaxis sensor kinase CheA
VRVVDRTLVLPLLSVIETVPLRLKQIVRVAEQGEVVMIRGESLPLLRLSRYLGLPLDSIETETAAETAGARRLAVIVETGNKKVGLVVDELLGQQQVVVKSLEHNLHRVDGLMGATILGDGNVAPIVDVAGLAALDLYSLQGSQRAGQKSRINAPRTRKTNLLQGGSANALV